MMRPSHQAVEKPDQQSRSTPLPIYSDVELRDLPSPMWQVDDLIQAQSLAGVYGSEGVGKSFLCLDIAFCIGLGIPFHGRKVAQGNVIYIYAEGVPGAKIRSEAWKQEHGLKPDDSGNVWFIPTSVDPTDRRGRGLKELLETIKATVPDVDLVIIDTLARCFGGGNENDTQDMNTFSNRCDGIRKELEATSLVVHHKGWEEKRERGNRAFRANFDTMIEMSGSSSRLKVECKKQKDGNPFTAFQLRRVQVTIPSGDTSCVLRGVGEQSVAIPSLKNRERNALAALSECGDLGATYAEWMARAIKNGMAGGTFKRTLRDDLKPRALVTTRQAGDPSKGFRYQLTPAGKLALGVQDGGGPDTANKLTEERGVQPEVQPKTPAPQAESNGSKLGPQEVQDPWPSLGPSGGAYKAPHEPKADVGISEKA